MQGKISIYGALPKVGRLRSRVENPGKDLTSKLRVAFQEAAIDVLNSSTMELRAAMIKKVAEMKLTYKNKQHEAQVFSLINDIFDSVFAGTNDALRAIVGSEDTDEADSEGKEEKADAEEEVSKPKKKESSKAKKKEEPSKTEKEEEEDDFSE